METWLQKLAKARAANTERALADMTPTDRAAAFGSSAVPPQLVSQRQRVRNYIASIAPEVEREHTLRIVRDEEPPVGKDNVSRFTGDWHGEPPAAAAPVDAELPTPDTDHNEQQ